MGEEKQLFLKLFRRAAHFFLYYWQKVRKNQFF